MAPNYRDELEDGVFGFDDDDMEYDDTDFEDDVRREMYDLDLEDDDNWIIGRNEDSYADNWDADDEEE